MPLCIVKRKHVYDCDRLLRCSITLLRKTQLYSAVAEFNGMDVTVRSKGRAISLYPW